MFYPLTGNGEMDKDLAEERQRDILEDVQADQIAEGDVAALDAENYQPVTEDDDEFVDARESNTNIHGGSDYTGRRHVSPATSEESDVENVRRD